MNNSTGDGGSIMTMLLIGLAIAIIIGLAGFGIGKKLQPDQGDIVKKMESERLLLAAAYEAKVKNLNVKIQVQNDKIALLYKTAVLKQQRISALEMKMRVIKTPQTPEDLRKRFAALGYVPIEGGKK